MFMIEIVARAFFASRCADFKSYETWEEDLSPGAKGNYLRAACAALVALRQPTEAMITNGLCEAMMYQPESGDAGEAAVKTWHAMIDAALSEAATAPWAELLKKPRAVGVNP